MASKATRGFGGGGEVREGSGEVRSRHRPTLSLGTFGHRERARRDPPRLRRRSRWVPSARREANRLCTTVNFFGAESTGSLGGCVPSRSSSESACISARRLATSAPGVSAPVAPTSAMVDHLAAPRERVSMEGWQQQRPVFMETIDDSPLKKKKKMAGPFPELQCHPIGRSWRGTSWSGEPTTSLRFLHGLCC